MKFSDFGNLGKIQTTAGSVPVQGTFACQFCPEEADYAEYDVPSKVLSWRCVDDHYSCIENWIL